MIRINLLKKIEDLKGVKMNEEVLKAINENAIDFYISSNLYTLHYLLFNLSYQFFKYKTLFLIISDISESATLALSNKNIVPS